MEPPLGDFQHTTIAEEDMRRLVRDINTAVSRVGERAIPAEDLDDLFDQSWPKLKAKLEGIKAQAVPAKKAKRGEREILDKILEIVRRQERRLGAQGGAPGDGGVVESGYVTFSRPGYGTVTAPKGSKLVRGLRAKPEREYYVRLLDGSILEMPFLPKKGATEPASQGSGGVPRLVSPSLSHSNREVR